MSDIEQKSVWIPLGLAIGLPLAVGAFVVSLVALTQAHSNLSQVETILATPPATPTLDSAAQSYLDDIIEKSLVEAKSAVRQDIRREARRIQSLVELQLAQTDRRQSAEPPTAQTSPQQTPPASTPEADLVQLGEKLTNRQCKACHSFQEGQSHRLGPNLWGVAGQPAAQQDRYSYSNALKSANVVWTGEALDGFLAGPRRYVPGTKMTYQGIGDADARAAIVAFLGTLNPQGAPQ